MSRVVAKSWQASARERILSSFKTGHRAVMLQLPPGLGKTLVALRVFRALKAKGFRLIVSVPGGTWRQRGSWEKELQGAKIPFAREGGTISGEKALRARLLTHRQLQDTLEGARSSVVCRWLQERRKALIVVDEIHRAPRRFRDELSKSYWTDDDSDLPHLLRYEGGRPPKYPLWLLLSGTPYNPVQLDYDIETRTRDIAPEMEDVRREAKIVADEVKKTLGMLGQLAGKGAARSELLEYVDQLREALRGKEPPRKRPPLAIVPADTATLEPRPPKPFKYYAPSVKLEECIDATWTIYQQVVIAKKLQHRGATAERLVLGGVRPSEKAKKTLLRHSYTSATVEAVKHAAPGPEELGYDAKLKSLVALVQRIRKSREAKMVIFCVHRATATAVARYLERSMSLTNGTVVDATLVSGGELKVKCNSFNQKGKPPFILVTTDKLSETIDLHRSCEILVHFELPWSPLRVLQRVGRLWRIKSRQQTKPSRAPVVFDIIHPCSVEEEILNRLHRRWKYLAALGLGYMSIKYGLGTRLPRVPWDIAHYVSKG